MRYLKRATAQSLAVPGDTATVQAMLDRIRSDGEDAVREYAKMLDNWSDDFILSDKKRFQLIDRVTENTKADIQFAWQQICRFAEAQKASLTEVKIETEPGVTLGHRLVPVQTVGCYVPGGRYAHAASALMSIATAKVAGVETIIACSPPRDGSINPAVVYAMEIAGADVIIEMGGVQAIASMAFGLFDNPKVDMIVGPGNSYVATAKKLLFGEVGIDVIAGPTESAIIADENADPITIAIDLASQAEHGPDSPVWLITNNENLGHKVTKLVPKIAAGMPNQETVIQAWESHAEVVLCEDRQEMVVVSDNYAPEHLQIMANDEEWWLKNEERRRMMMIMMTTMVLQGGY